MFRLPRSLRRRLLLFRPRLLILLLAIIITLDALYLLRSRVPDVRVSVPSTIPLSNATKPAAQKIFIASIHRNNEYMLRLYWSRAMIDLVKTLGPENVFISILESGSLEDTKGALTDLKVKLDELGVKNVVSLGMTADEQVESLIWEGGDDGGEMRDEERNGGRGKDGWVFTGRGRWGWEVRRIPHLAKLRNQAMEPLKELEEKGEKFEKVMWVNDVVFTTEDVLTLLETRNGEYAAACALDFSGNAESYYDTFALRDFSGAQTISLTYPYFTSPISRNALRAMVPIPVQSCWNGLVVFDAEPFYNGGSDGKGLKFRGVDDSLAALHVEGSECCLIHSDNSKISIEKGIFLNPNVRVTYNASTYTKINHGVLVQASEPYNDITSGIEGGDGRPWPGDLELVRGVWANRIRRWVGRGWVEWWNRNTMEKRVKRWVELGMGKGEERRENGVGCLINEMQVLFESGWKHV